MSTAIDAIKQPVQNQPEAEEQPADTATARVELGTPWPPPLTAKPLSTATGPADVACSHLLDRCQTDPEFWKVMGHTDGFRLLCAAQASITGEPLDAVMRARSIPKRVQRG